MGYCPPSQRCNFVRSPRNQQDHARASRSGSDRMELFGATCQSFCSRRIAECSAYSGHSVQKLMELDRTVVLFDEIDDLVREREREPDSFGRFLTNSMLPKLAQLWKQRKIIYFVATNHIGYFDRAVTRSERFDALILVSPPSFDAKVKRLRDLLRRRTANGIEIQMDFSKRGSR